MNNLSSINTKSLIYSNLDTKYISKKNQSDTVRDADESADPEIKSAVASANTKRKNTIFNFGNKNTKIPEKSPKIALSSESLKINCEGDGSIVTNESESSEEHSVERNAGQSVFQLDGMNTIFSSSLNKLDSPYKNNKKNSAQVLANNAESDGALFVETDKRSENKARVSQFRLPRLSFGENSQELPVSAISPRSNRSNTSGHLNSFTSKINSPRSTRNESNASELKVLDLSPQSATPRATQIDSDKFNKLVTPSQSRAFISNAFTQPKADPAEKQIDVFSRIRKSQWRIFNKNNEDANAVSAINRISISIRNLLADDYIIIVSGKNFQSMPVYEREIFLKEELGARFISHVMRMQGDDFDPALLSSFSKLSSFMKNKC